MQLLGPALLPLALIRLALTGQAGEHLSGIVVVVGLDEHVVGRGLEPLDRGEVAPPAGARMRKSNAIIRPNHMPARAPRPAALPVVMRPVICSTDRSPFPTMRTFSTGNPLSERRSTISCAIT